MRGTGGGIGDRELGTVKDRESQLYCWAWGGGSRRDHLGIARVGLKINEQIENDDGRCGLGEDKGK